MVARFRRRIQNWDIGHNDIEKNGRMAIASRQANSSRIGHGSGRNSISIQKVKQRTKFHNMMATKYFCASSNYILVVGILTLAAVNLVSVHNFITTSSSSSSSTYWTVSSYLRSSSLSSHYFRYDISIVLATTKSRGDSLRPFQIYHETVLEASDEEEPNYGDIKYMSLLKLLPRTDLELNPAKFRRKINPTDYEWEETVRSELLDTIDLEKLDSAKYDPNEDIEDLSQTCKRNSWKSSKYPNCNEIHTLVLERPSSQSSSIDIGTASSSSVLQPFNLKYLGHGHFRNAWLVSTQTSQQYVPTNATTILDKDHDNEGEEEHEFVMKRLRLNKNFPIDYYDMSKIHREAIIMERLTASPRIVNIYGYCSTTIFAEAMGGEIWHDMVPGTGHIQQSELDLIQTEDVHPLNTFTPIEKLDMSIEMAEALADMHGYKGGTFLHGDTHPEQWLKAKNGRLVLNDFNNAEILDWDTTKNQYCRVYRDYGGFYRAPEEYGDFVTETVDTYSLGNNIYCLLTGLWPFYPWDDYSYIRNKILKKHERAYIDPRYNRSFIESRLVDIIEQTWEFDGTKRISIFDVVKFLKESRREFMNPPNSSNQEMTHPRIRKNHNFKII